MEALQNPTNRNAVTDVRQPIGDFVNGNTEAGFKNMAKINQNLPVVSDIERGKFINKLIPFTNTFFRINFALKN